MKSTRAFERIARSFADNIHAVRALNDRVGGHADEHDRTRRDTLIKDTVEALGIREWVREAKERGEDLETLRDALEDGEGVETFVKSALERPGVGARLSRVLREYRRMPAIQGDLLRRGALTTLLAFFESLVADVIQAYYERNPDALPQDAQNLSLAELKNLGSIEEAERYILEKESESVLRGSLEDQLKYLTGRLKLDLSALGAIKSLVAEIVQRRNIIVHNSGLVNRTYLAKVNPEIVTRYDAKEATKLSVPQSYLVEAISTVWRAGTIILQQGWRKWDASSNEAADSYLLEHSYDLLVGHIDADVVALSDYVKTFKSCADRTKRVILVNAATALRRLNRASEIDPLIQSCDWTSCSLDLQLALAALRVDITGACELLPRAVASGDIVEANIKEWPLFEILRENSEFMSLVDRLFPGVAIDSPVEQSPSESTT